MAVLKAQRLPGFFIPVMINQNAPQIEGEGISQFFYYRLTNF